MLLKLARSALDLVFPIPCAGCGREGAVLCGECVEGEARLVAPYCSVCAAPGVSGVCQWCERFPRGFDSLRAPFRFDGAVRDAVHRLKYRGERTAARPLGGLMSEYLERNPAAVDMLVPAPLHPRRLRSRGYNQSALLAREMGRNLDLPVEENLLARLKNPRPQVETGSQQERRDNVSGNFACAADASGLAVLLVDDVATTGSTLSECAAALKAAGASAVYALALARDG